MSYKLHLGSIARDSGVSLTQQIVDGFAAAIDAGSLEPGERLPTTRALAETLGVNHLTASRAYRRLAEMGYVTATVGRGTFVRTLPPSAAEREGDDWQHSVLPDRPWAYRQQSLDDAFRLASVDGVISLSTAWPAPETVPVQALLTPRPPCSPSLAAARSATRTLPACPLCARSSPAADERRGSPPRSTRSS